MVCSHYIAKGYDMTHDLLYFAKVFSFDEALYNFNNWREDERCCFFEISYPGKEYVNILTKN